MTVHLHETTYGSPTAQDYPLSSGSPHRSAFLWAGIGFWCMGFALTWIDIYINADNDLHGQTLLIFLIVGSFATLAFSTVYSVYWQIRTRRIDLRPAKRLHFGFGVVGFLILLGLMAIIFSMMRSPDSPVGWLCSGSLLLSAVISAELCRITARRFARNAHRVVE